MTPAKPAQPIQEEDISHYVLGSDDTLKIWALGIEEISDKPVRIDPSGDIDLPVVGKVHARGLSLEELKVQLMQRLSKEVLKPQVSAEIVDFGTSLCP